MIKKLGFLAAFIALVFLLLPVRTTDKLPHLGKNTQPRFTEQNISPVQEIRLKQMHVASDVSATDQLCRNQCSLDFKTALRKIGNSGNTEAAQKILSDTQKEHPHMKHLVLSKKGNGKEQVTAVGKIPDEVSKKAAEEWKSAEQEAAQGHSYQSGPISTRSGTYFVLAIPSLDGKSILTGVIHQKILSEVREHQMKDLRVVPYPAEGRWKIESVDTDTLKDKTVKHPEQNEGTSHYHQNQVVVKFKSPPTAEQIKQIRRELNGATVHKLGYTYVFESSDKEAKQMMSYFKKWNIEYAEPHYLYLTNSWIPKQHAETSGDTTSGFAADNFQPNDVLYSKYQWNLPNIETVQGWGIGRGNQNVTVGIIDTGVDLSHPDLQGHLLSGMNVVSDGKTPPNDDVGHGTHVAGVITALVNNEEGVAGMTWYNPVLPVKVLDSSGSGSTYAVAQGVIWAADHGAKVINMSLGNYADANFLHDAIKYAYDKDIVIVAASGNDNTERPSFPAAYPEVFAVAATDPDKNKASFSNYGDYVDVAAPGVSIASTYMNNQYAALSGTSMASPHVAALAALIRSVNPSLKNTEVMDIMRKSAEDIGPAGKDKYFGYGVIDVNSALQAAYKGMNQTANQTKPAAAPSLWSDWLQRQLTRLREQFQ